MSASSHTAARRALTPTAQRRSESEHVVPETRDMIGRVRTVIGQAVAHHRRLALLYSGGIKSSLLLCLAEPWRDSVTVYTVRTGAEFPHMVAFTDTALEGWEHRIIETDLTASFRDRGIPANAVPIEHAHAFAPFFGEQRRPAIVDWVTCCLENRGKPGFEAVKRDGFAAVVHGQRLGDFRAHRAPTSYEGLEVIAPLWDTPRPAMWQAIKALGVQLPEQYPDFADSLDCAICPASLTPARRTWMAKRYPDQLRIAEALHAMVVSAVGGVLKGETTLHAHDPA